MKAYFQKNKLILLFTSLLVIIFVVGGIYSRFMTNQITFHQYKDLFEGTTKLVEYTPTQEVDETILGDDTSLVRSFKSYVGSEQVGFIFVVETTGKMKGLQIAYAIDSSSDQVVGMKVVQTKETPEYFARLTPAFFNQFNAYSLDKLNITIDSVSGATMTADAFKVALTFARLQYALETDFVIPSALVIVNTITYNNDFMTIAQKPFIVNLTDLSSNETIDVYVSASFDFVEVITSQATTPSEAALAELKATLNKDYFSYTRVQAVSYDSTSREFVVRTFGNDGFITFTFVLNPEHTAIVSTTSVTSSESYVDGGYDTHGQPPGLENFLLNRYLNDQSIDVTAGATYTFNAMVRLFTYLDVMLSGNGGQE